MVTVELECQHLVFLISSYYLHRSLVVGAFLFYKDERTVCGSQQTIRAGDHVKTVARFHLPRMVDDQDRNTAVIAELLQGSDILVISRIAIAVIPGISDFLKRVYDDQSCIRIFQKELFELLDQSIVDGSGACPR